MIENRATATNEEGNTRYIASLSCRTIVYKGLFTGTQLAGFYEDLKDPDMASAMVVVHQRYSTNTFWDPI